MKHFWLTALLAALVLLAVPVALTNGTAPAGSAPDESAAAVTDDGTIAVFRSAEAATETVDTFEYVCGSVAAEMPLTYRDEALKAQAVACRTNALRLKAAGGTDGADITDDSTVHQGYLGRDERRQKWGDAYEQYEKKLEAAVKATGSEVLTSGGELCVAAFSAVSSGVTESAEVAWGGAVPYLVSVQSPGDPLAPAYLSTVLFTREQFAAAAATLGAALPDDADLKTALTVQKTSDAGTVTEAELCGKHVTGEEVRAAFSLASPCFTVSASDSGVTFRCTGQGHGVGMSQYGADYMAGEGKTYKEILAHYYTGAQITKAQPKT